MDQELIYRFDRFSLDAQKHILLKDGEQIHLTPKVFDVLIELLSAGGRVVSRAELMKRIWPDSYVEDSNVSQSISMLRRALEDGNGNGGRRYIETVWCKGYRIVAEVKNVGTENVSTLHVNTLARSEKDGTRLKAANVGGAREAAAEPVEYRNGIERLTPAERRVLAMIAGNRTSREIADQLKISVRTVESHRAKIRAKLGISGPNALLGFALEHKWEISGAAGEC